MVAVVEPVAAVMIAFAPHNIDECEAILGLCISAIGSLFEVKFVNPRFFKIDLIRFFRVQHWLQVFRE